MATSRRTRAFARLIAEDADHAADRGSVATEAIPLGGERRFQVRGHHTVLRPRLFDGQVARGRAYGADRGSVRRRALTLTG